MMESNREKYITLTEKLKAPHNKKGLVLKLKPLQAKKYIDKGLIELYTPKKEEQAPKKAKKASSKGVTPKTEKEN